MSIKTNLTVGAFGTVLLAAGVQSPAQAQANPGTDLSVAESSAAGFLEAQTQVWQPATATSADGWTLPERTQPSEMPPITQASELMEAAEKDVAYQNSLGADSLEFDAITLIDTSQTNASQSESLQPEAAAESAYPTAPAIEIAQRRRRNPTTSNSNQSFIGVAADIGYFDDVTFGVISKLSLNEQVSIRPSALIGDGYFAALVPVTYEFNQYTTNVSGFQISPYAGVGIAYNSFDTLGENESTVDMLLSAGADMPISQKFTLNAQLNYTGIFDDFDGFGVTVGVGYNLGNLFR